MNTILDQLKVQFLISGEKLGDCYKLYNVLGFQQCDDIQFWNDLSRIFKCPECILVQFKSDLPQTILKPLIWKKDDGLVYRIGNLLLPITASNKGIYINDEIKLEYDTLVSNGKEYLSFSYLVRNKGQKPYDVPAQLLFMSDIDPTEITKKAKSLFKTGDYQELIDILLPYIREISLFKNSASLAHFFRHISENFEEYQDFLGGTIALIVKNPRTFIDPTYNKLNVEMEVDGANFAERINDTYLVKSWGEMKPLEEINSIVFSEGIVKNNDYLKSIAYDKNCLSNWAVMIVTGPNRTRTDWPPSVSFIPDYLLSNQNVFQTVARFFPSDFEFPKFSESFLPKEEKKTKVSFRTSESKTPPKFLKAAKDFSYDDKQDKKSAFDYMDEQEEKDFVQQDEDFNPYAEQ